MHCFCIKANLQLFEKSVLCSYVAMAMAAEFSLKVPLNPILIV